MVCLDWVEPLLNAELDHFDVRWVEEEEEGISEESCRHVGSSLSNGRKVGETLELLKRCVKLHIAGR
jgi:hypothetical protein